MRFDHLFKLFSRRLGAGSLVLLCTLVAIPAPAVADEWLDKAQRDMGLIPGNKSVEQVLFPALLGMEPLPSDEVFMLFPRGDERFQDLIEWAQRPAQQAVLEAVDTVTDPDENYMFSLQIGRDKVDSAWADAGLYIEGGYEGLLADVDYKYLLEMFAELLKVHYASAIAQAESGDGDEALKDYAQLLALYRLLLERPSATEKFAAITAIEMICDLMTDLVYQYTRLGDTTFTPRGIADAVLETDDAVQRFRFRDFNLPRLTEYEVRQALDWATEGGARVDAKRFAMLMALRDPRVEGLSRIGVFSAHRSMGALQLDRVAYERKIRDVFADYTRRWNYSSLHDAALRLKSVGEGTWVDYELIARFVEMDYPSLFERRIEMLTSLSGMRCALAIVAFRLENNNLPGRIVSIQPSFLRSLSNNLDYQNFNQRIGTAEPLRYWVPIRDESFGPRETPAPYVIRAVFDSRGFRGSGSGIPAASRAVDLRDAIPFPGFGERGREFADTEKGFDPSQFADLVGIDFDAFTGIRAEQTARDFVVQGALPRFGLPEEAHASLEAFLSGESDTFDYGALRTLIKQSLSQNAPSEREANQFSVVLAGLAYLGYTPDNMAQKFRQDMERAINERARRRPTGIDPSLFADDPLTMAMVSGDMDQVSQLLFGKSQRQLADYYSGVAGRVAAVPSFKEAMRRAAAGEFLSSSQLVQLMRDMADALVVPEVMNPLREMLIHFRSSKVGETIRDSAAPQSGGTPVTFAIDENSFLLYSVGDNGIDDRAALADDGTAGDRLFWPPTLSLYREQLNR